MSTLVMVEKHGVGAIAADTLTTFGSRKQSARYVVSGEKLLPVGDAWIGVVGWAAHIDVLDSVFSNGLRLPDFKSRRDLFEFSRKLHCKLKDDYFLNTDDDCGDAYESSQMALFFLNRHGLFALYSDRSVNKFRRFAALGSGSSYALGAMHAAYNTDMNARAIARAGVEAGVEFDASSSGPVTVKQLKLDA